MGNMMADQFTLASFSRPPLAMYTSNLILTQRRVAALKAGIGSTIRNDHFRPPCGKPRRRSRPRTERIRKVSRIIG